MGWIGNIGIETRRSYGTLSMISSIVTKRGESG